MVCLKTNRNYRIEKKLKRIIQSSIPNNINKSLAAISALAQVYYEANQFYMDEFLEESILEIANQRKRESNLIVKKDSQSILFYDGMGQDTRGLAFEYLEALCKTGYSVIHVVNENARNVQPKLIEMLEEYHVITVYIPSNFNYVERISFLDDISQRYDIQSAFIYSLPYDSAAITFFTYRNDLKRFFINFTDHAFWIGINSFDKCIEFRNYGYSISIKNRKIEKDKLVMLPFYALVDKNTEFQGLPFDLSGKKLVFSGGAVYKTDSEDRLYFDIVKRILLEHEDTVFLYAGNGASGDLKEIVKTFPDRAYWVSERKDFYCIMERCFFYLNTYPLAGGLMTRYAAMAGKIPITLKHQDDAEGCLKNQDELGVFFDKIEDLFLEIEKIYNDSSYKEIKEKMVIESVMSESLFRSSLDDLIKNGNSEIETKILDIDTRTLQEEYLRRFSDTVYQKSIAKRINSDLISAFPILFLKRYLHFRKKGDDKKCR